MTIVTALYYGNRSKIHALWFCVLWSVVFISVAAQKKDCKLHKRDSKSDHERENELLKKLEPIKGERLHVEDGNYTYYLGICTNANALVPNKVGLMQYSHHGNYSLGSIDEVGIMGGNDWLLLTYYGGARYEAHCNKTNRTSHIMVVCDPTVLLGKLRVLEERLKTNYDECFYLFEIGSNITCNTTQKAATEPHHSLSSGSVFCILVFTFAGIYLLLGFLYQRIVIGAKGLEQIPNYGFWRSFGNLQADGCDYICRCGPRQESQAYRGIDDRIRTDEERDDQLLNM